MKLEKERIKIIKELAKRGLSLAQISKITAISKSTLYYHLKGIVRKCKKMDLSNLSEFERGYITGMFVGDGNFDIRKENYSYRVVFNLNRKSEQPIISHLIKILKKGGANPYVSNYRNLSKVIVVSKRLYEYLNTFVVYKKSRRGNKVINKKICIKNFSSWSKDFKFGFISGLLDSDGYVGPHGNGIRAFIFTSSHRLATQVYQIVKSLNLEASIRTLNPKNLWYIRIFSKSIQCEGLKSVKLMFMKKRMTMQPTQPFRELKHKY